jgi:hypothetical protein
VSVGNKFIDVVWRGSIEIPLVHTKDYIQIVLKTLGENEKKLGSLSIPMELFFSIDKKKTYSHWVTLFDYLEDDIYDGDLGADDEERPRTYIRYSVIEDASSKTTQSSTIKSVKTTREEFKGSPRRGKTTTKTTKTTVSYSSKQSPPRTQIVTQTETVNFGEPEPETLRVTAQRAEPTMEVVRQDASNVERYSVRVIEGDLRADTKGLKQDLKDHQNE